MFRTLGWGSALVAALWLVSTQGSWAQDKKVNLRVLMPQADAKVSVDKKDIDSTGFERKIAVNVPAGAKEVTVSATWEPNGYTKFIRTRKVEVKDGELVADLSRADNTQKDDIQVIYVPTPQDIVEEMCKLGAVTKDDIVYDLGCGDGRMVITAVKDFGAKRGVGIDFDPERVKDSQENAKKNDVEKKVAFRQGDVLKVDDISDASVVLLYMGEDINLRLRPLLQKQMKPGSRVVSHRFPMGDWQPSKTVHVKGKNGYDYTLHLWVIGEKK